MAVFIIAEAGVNHNGSLATAIQLVDAAVDAGADAVKFQTFKAEKLAIPTAPTAGYQISHGLAENQLAMLKNLELKYEFHLQLRDYCRQQNILFLSTAFDFDSLAFLVDEIEVERLKIPSGEITNGPFLLAYAKTNKNIILSTGMASLGEVEAALSVLAFAYINTHMEPSETAFQECYASPSGQNVLKQKVTLLHCTSAYPTPMQAVNLRAMDVLQQAFGLAVGYSDHTEGIVVPIAAVARGASLIEKHFTLDKTQPGPDHKVSLEPNELKQMVVAIRSVEAALGNSCKTPDLLELETRCVARKSLVAAKAIKAGEKFSVENLACKRPGTGSSPMEYWRWLGQVSNRSYEQDDLIK